jgi:hypothetical protein
MGLGKWGLGREAKGSLSGKHGFSPKFLMSEAILGLGGRVIELLLLLFLKTAIRINIT